MYCTISMFAAEEEQLTCKTYLFLVVSILDLMSYDKISVQIWKSISILYLQ